MSAVDLLKLQLAGEQRGRGMLSDFAANMRMKQLIGAASGVSSAEEFRQFAADNNLDPQEVATLAAIIGAQRKAFTPIQQPTYYSSAGTTIYDKRTGRPTYDVSQYKPTDWYRVNKDGSVESRSAKSGAEANVFESQGFRRGKYRQRPEGGSTGKPIKTWVVNGRLWHAPSDVMPPKGAKPWSQAGELERRLLIGQELTNLRTEKNRVRRELDRIIALPDGVSIYKPQKDRIPELREELADISARQNSLLGHGNQYNTDNQPVADPAILGGFNAAEHNGRVLTNPDTGERRKSNGKVWEKIE